MKTKLLGIFGGLALAMTGAGCGDDGGPSADTCGSGTTFDEASGTCVPDIDGCADGTTLMDGQCVPDGSVICETGTTYDEESGTCVPDITGCAEGTVLVSGECVPEDETLTGDIQEPAEPNGNEVGATVGAFDLPAEGEDVVIEGCVEPRPDLNIDDNVDADLDFYILNASGPALVEFTVDGVGGMAGGFQIIGITPELAADGWVRLGINMVGDTAQRQVYLPMAGQYLLILADSRSLFLGEGVGDGTNTCYFATVAHVATPSPTALTAGTPETGTIGPDSAFYGFDPADGDMVDATVNLETVSDAISGSIVQMVDGSYMGSGETSSPVTRTLAGLSDNSNVMYVVESVLDIQLTPVDYTVDVAVTPATALSASGTTDTLTIDNTEANYYYFDATGGDVVRFEFDAPDNFTVDLHDMRGNSIGPIADATVASDVWGQFPADGRFTVSFINEDTTTGTTDVDVTRTHVTPDTLTFGTAETGAPLTDDGSHFYELSLTDVLWMTFAVTGTDIGGTALLDIFDRTETGIVSPLAEGLADGSQAITGAALTATFLVRVYDDDFGNAGGSPTADLTIDSQDFGNEMTVDEANPVDLNGVTLAADASLYYLFQVGMDAEYTITVTGANDLVLATLDDAAQPDTIVDDNGNGGDEVFSETVSESTWVAFEVFEASGTADTIDVNIDVVDPTYGVTIAEIDLGNACLSGERVDMGDGVSEVIDIGFDFPYFGATKTQFIISELGWLTFDTTYAGDGTFGTADDVIAPHASDDLTGVDVCVRKQANRVVVQWRGDDFGFLPMEMQAIISDNGNVEFRYGPDSDLSFTGVVGFTGFSNDDGSEEFDWEFTIDPNMQLIYTPK